MATVTIIGSGMMGSALAILAFWAVPTSAPLAVKLTPFLFIGFFIYGPQALLGIATTQQATPRAAGVAGGFVGIFSYASTVLSGIGFGSVAQCWGWNAAYATICCAAVFGGLVLLAMWRADAGADIGELVPPGLRPECGRLEKEDDFGHDRT